MYKTVLLAAAAIQALLWSTLGASAQIPMVDIPNLFGLSVPQAQQALAHAGLNVEILQQDSLCGSAVDGRIIELGQICQQHPPAGRRATRWITVVVQSEDPRHGRVGKHNEWHLMPDVVGMTLDEAQAEMRKAGFTNQERIHVNPVQQPECETNHICSTYPKALERVGQNSDKFLDVGAP